MFGAHYEKTQPNIENLVAGIYAAISVNIGDFTKHTLLQFVASGSWIGNDSVYLSSVALEYPPLLTVMVQNLHTNKMYRNKTSIGRAMNSIERSVDFETVASFINRL